MSRRAPRIAVVIPAFNESATIATVVGAFREALSEATIFVIDNNSSDATADLARAAGAEVRAERLQGKGHAVRRAFADLEADVYVLVDGDDTYDAAAAPAMVQMLVDQHLDMVTGVRANTEKAAYRPAHRFGNTILTGLVRYVFGDRTSDMLSGYRVFSRRFIKSFPALSAGFETETEFTVHALELNMPIGEIRTRYKSRPSGSVSKLRTIRDGVRILRTIFLLAKEEKPLQLFSIASAILMAAGLLLGLPVVLEFSRTGLVPRLPTAVLATGLVLLSCLSATAGLILDTVTRGRREMKRLAYLAIPATEGTRMNAPAPAGASENRTLVA